MKIRILFATTLGRLAARTSVAQKPEVACTSGVLKIGERGFDLPSPGFLKFGNGFTYEISYATRLIDAKLASLYFEVPLAGTPSTKVKTTNALSPNSYSS